MRVESSELMAVTDIADLCGVRSTAVTNWQKRYADFPEPVAIVARGEIKLWRRVDILRWTKPVEGLSTDT